MQSCTEERRVSLNSKRTLQVLNRAAATEKLRKAAPLWSFKTKRAEPEPPSPTIAAASREQVSRLYAGPTVRTASNWEAQHDSPGPQAYNVGDKWRHKFRNMPSARIELAQCARHMEIPTKPGPGDYNIAHHSVGENARAVKFAPPTLGKKNPPRTPDHPRAKVPCSYAEPEHVSCLHQQRTSDRATSPAVSFSGAPRFEINTGRRPAPTVIPRSTPKKGTKSCIRRSPIAAGSRRWEKRKKRRRGGPQIFRRGDYSWLASWVEPEEWEPRLKLLDDERGGCHGNGSGLRPSSTTMALSRSNSLVQNNAPRPMLRRGRRYNQSEHNPQRRDLPRERDNYPGPKYDRPPGAFGRTGGGGGNVAPSASILRLDRFARGRLFPEEEMREREATPGPEAYDVDLGSRLEGHSLEMMQGSLETLKSWSSLGCGRPDDWPFSSSRGNGDLVVPEGSGRGADASTAASHDGVDPTGVNGGEEKRPACASEVESGADEDRHREESRSERVKEVTKRTIFGRSCSPCFAGGSATPDGLQRPDSMPPSMAATTMMPATQKKTRPRRAGPHCSRLPPALSAAALVGIPCPECLGVEVTTAVNNVVAAAAAVFDPNLYRRAKMTGASVRFGDMPRQRSAPAFSIGTSQRDAAARLLHVSSAETIYKQVRLGRSGSGPTTASPRAGDTVTRRRPVAARVVLPPTRGCARDSRYPKGGRSETVVAAGGTEPDRGLLVIDGAFGAQVKSCRPTSPSFTLAGPRRAATLFHERLRYSGKDLSAEQQHLTQPGSLRVAHSPKEEK